MIEKKMNVEDFAALIKCLSILKDICNDVDIRGGYIRQKINSRASLFELDLNPLIGNIDLPIISIKTKLDILKPFLKCETTIRIERKKYSFYDDNLSVEFEIPVLNYLDNQYMDDEEYDKLMELNPEDLILTIDLDKKTTDRIKKIAHNFNETTVKMILENGKAYIMVSSDSKNKAKFLKEIDIRMDINTCINIDLTPFTIEHDDDINISVYNMDNSCLIQFKTHIGDVDIKISARSPFVDPDVYDM